jgi:raffinose/stachyose/melibiose transport system substrate-binding protein
MRKALSALVVILVALFCVYPVFAGGKGETGASSTGSQAASASIVLWDVQTTGKMKDIIDKEAAQFSKDTGVQLQVVHIENDPYKTKLKVAMGGGTPPDIFHNWGGGPLKAYVDAGMVAPIDDIKANLDKRYIPASFDPVTFEGHTYGTAYGGLTGVYFWYRKDILAKYNVSVPKTWADLMSAVKTLKDNGIIPISLANQTKWPSSFYYMYIADRIGGANLFLNVYDGKASFEDPAYIKTGQLIQDLVKAGAFPQGFNGMSQDNGESRQLIYTGRAAMYLMGAWFYDNLKADSPDNVKNIDFFTFPTIQGGKGDPTDLIGSPGQDYYSISTKSKNRKAAEEFLSKYVMNDEWVQFMLANGRTPPVKGVSGMISDPMLKKNAKAFEDAAHVQVYWDQFLPPSVGEMHKDLVQSLFGLSITPAEMGKKQEQAITDWRKTNQ